MKSVRSVYIHSNDSKVTRATLPVLREKLLAAGIEILPDPKQRPDMMICVGGDGTFLRLLRYQNFPDVPVVGINTGHLGFFQEFMHDELDLCIKCISEGDYSLQSHRPLRVRVWQKNQSMITYYGINDIVVRKNASSIVHLKINIDRSFVEKFSGDGVLISSPAGSTAYNYSVGGAIVDPRVEVLQLAPIAPMNTASYRSFTSSVLLPPDNTITIYPEYKFIDKMLVIVDGAEYQMTNMEKLQVDLADRRIRVVRRSEYDFWTNVKEKFF
jgi:NAD+ kinase